MDLLGIEISETATKWTAISSIITALSGIVWAIIERRQKQKLKNTEIKKAEIENKKFKIENADTLHEIHAEILEGTKKSEEHRNRYFINQIEFCEENIEDFIKFIVEKRKNENRNKTNT